MLDANNLERRKIEIERDFTSFADPNTRVDVAAMGHHFRVTWVARAESREVTFSALKDEDYRNKIAGEKLADLRNVATMIDRTFKFKDTDNFVATKAMYQSQNSSSVPRPAIDVLTELLEEGVSDATRVIMLTGAAGAGKTRLLRELVRRQADKYLRGQTNKLLLYVDAQGRALARLNEALATELQDLRVGLTYHSVAVLARLGFLVPVIDGFDELLGVSGYDDAFSSLAGLLEQLKGQGQLLASARSVYYEEEFLDRAPRVDAETEQAWEHIPVRLIDWSEEDREAYLVNWMRRKNISEEDGKNIRTSMKNIFSGANADLSSKPLFFTRSVDLLHNRLDFSYGDDPLRGISNQYLLRELQEKFLDRDSQPLLTEAQFHRLMRELAEEMWNQDTRELDYNSIRVVAEYVAEDEGLPETARTAVIERMPTLAFQGHGGRPGSHTGAFEHELFFFYFLGQLITSRLRSEEGDMALLLSRSALPEDVADRVAQELDPRDRLQKLIDRLIQSAKKEWIRKFQVRENAGLLIMALLRRSGQIENCVVESVDFPGSHLRDVSLIKCSLTDVTIRRTDLTSTQFVGCEMSNMTFVEPKLGDSTRLDAQGISLEQFFGIRKPNGETIYEPSAIAANLVECGASIPNESIQSGKRNIPVQYIEVLERLMRAYGRSNPVCKGDDNLSGIFQNSAWEVVEKLLVDQELVVSEIRRAGGPRKTFFRRRFSTKQFMAGVNRNSKVDRRIQEFWQALEFVTPDN